MSINFTGGAVAYATMIDNFAKTISRTPVTKTTDNITGDETLTDGTPANISGALFTKEDSWIQDKPGLLQNADAVLLVKPSVTINKNDKLTYDSEDFRIKKVETRRLDGTAFYKVAQCFLI